MVHIHTSKHAFTEYGLSLLFIGSTAVLTNKGVEVKSKATTNRHGRLLPAIPILSNWRQENCHESEVGQSGLEC